MPREHIKDRARELLRAAALHEQNMVRRRDLQLSADELLELQDDCTELFRAMRDLCDAYARILEVE
jgi:hypothetical protein